MVLSNAERQQRHRQRVRAKLATAEAGPPPWELPQVDLRTMTDEKLKAEIDRRWKMFEPAERWMKAAVTELESRYPEPPNLRPTPGPFEVLNISIAGRSGTDSRVYGDIEVPSGRTPAGDVSRLARSIKEIGLLNPITVRATQIYQEAQHTREGYSLIAGLDRLEACKSLGHETIRAHVVDLDGPQSDLAAIDEGLIRNELPLIRRAELLWLRSFCIGRLAQVT